MPNLIAPLAGISDHAVVSALRALTDFLNKVTPIAKYQYVTVTFNGTANADTDIVHTLAPVNPETVLYWVVKVDRAARIYNDTGATRKAWTPSVIYLRSDTANAVATLLLFLPAGN